jgi:hypothetical protein
MFVDIAITKLFCFPWDTRSYAAEPQDDIMNTIQTPAGQRLKVLAAPAVRHMAKANSIDLSLVSGSGRDGRVTKVRLKHSFFPFFFLLNCRFCCLVFP